MGRDDITDADVQMVLAVYRVRHGTNEGATADGIRQALQKGFWPIDEYRAIAELASQQVQRALEEAQSLLTKVDVACLEVCGDNHAPKVGEDAADPELGRYVCMNENGDPLVDTDDPAEVIRALYDFWGRVSEQLEAAQVKAQRLREALVKVRSHTGRLPGASAELLDGLLTSVERIAETALTGPGGDSA